MKKMLALIVVAGVMLSGALAPMARRPWDLFSFFMLRVCSKANEIANGRSVCDGAPVLDHKGI